MFRRSRGKEAENIACKFIKRHGLKVIKKNFRSKFGEIDIIALDKNTLVFLEVRSVSSLKFGLPEESITSSKKRKLVNTAQVFIKNNETMKKYSYRFDFIGIVWKTDKPDIKWIKNVFEVP